MKTKKPQFYSKIQRVTADAGTVQTNPQILESKDQPAIVKHATYISNPLITLRTDNENSNSQILKSFSTAYTAEPLRFFTDNLEKEAFWRNEYEKSISSQTYADTTRTTNSSE